MKEKLKSKFSDVILTFLSSVIAIYLFLKSNSFLVSLMETLGVPAERVNMLLGVYFSTIVSVIYVLMLLFLVVFQKSLSFIARPKIVISFYNKKGKTEHELDFKEQPEEPRYLKISFLAKFSSFQLFLLRDILKAKVLISLNPKMCAIELYEGFVGTNDDYKIIEHSLQCDFFPKFLPSSEEKGLDTELSLLLINSAKGEIIVGLDLSDTNKVFKMLFKNYCKFDVVPIRLEG